MVSGLIALILEQRIRQSQIILWSASYMYYGFCDHIYVTQFRTELILLDLKRDKYTVCLPQFSELLINLLKVRHLDNVRLLQNSSVQQLTKHQILKQRETPYPFYIDHKPNSLGVANADWRLPLEKAEISFDVQVLKALIVLIKVNFYIKFRGFYATIQLIKKSYNNQQNYRIPKEQELKSLADIVNKACLVYPTRTKCLEWAITYVLLALKRKWRCNLKIGVQNYPFIAHAWVECDEKVVMDSQDLRKGLAIILNEPFRKLKI